MFNKIIKKYNKLSDLDKYHECIKKLTETEQKIFKYEDNMFKRWDDIESLFNFRDKYDYYDYMTDKPDYIKLINLKIEFEKEIKKLYDEHIKKMQEPIILHKEQLEH